MLSHCWNSDKELSFLVDLTCKGKWAESHTSRRWSLQKMIHGCILDQLEQWWDHVWLSVQLCCEAAHHQKCLVPFQEWVPVWAHFRAGHVLLPIYSSWLWEWVPFGGQVSKLLMWCRLSTCCKLWMDHSCGSGSQLVHGAALVGCCLYTSRSYGSGSQFRYAAMLLGCRL